jgi:hypothetical protein
VRSPLAHHVPMGDRPSGIPSCRSAAAAKPSSVCIGVSGRPCISSLIHRHIVIVRIAADKSTQSRAVVGVRDS